MNSTLDASFRLSLDKGSATPLTDQIHRGIAAAIDQDVLRPGTRLPSWIDLAAQLGVARGTVRVAYEKLAADQLIEASRAAGTRVAERPASARRGEEGLDPGPFVTMYRELTAGPGLFQPGIPSRESLPSKLMTRLRARALTAETTGAALYPDPRGELELRREIAAYLAVARGLVCSPDQVLITGGYAAGLGIALRALCLEGKRAWMEEPGFFFTRHALTLGGLTPVPVRVDEEGLDVEEGWREAPDAALAVVTAGQQAPLGVTMSLQRRLRLLDWARRTGGWIVEDDYLSELQLQGRAAPALASLDPDGRVIHIGSFSKTIDPRLRLGFVVVPATQVARFGEVAACLAPPPGPATQAAIATFLRDGHYLRHLRRTKRQYLAQRDALLRALQARGLHTHPAALAVLVRTPDGASDMAIARALFSFGIAPAPLSVWYARPEFARSGLMLSVASAPLSQIERACDRVAEVLGRRWDLKMQHADRRDAVRGTKARPLPLRCFVLQRSPHGAAMPTSHSSRTDLPLGIASGLAGGLIGAAAMTAFQELLERVGITSGVRGWPSTERAADRLAKLSGRRLPAGQRPVAGEAVHYAFGSLLGGVYGAAAELDPRVTCGHGTAFGIAAATVVDEGLVPAMRFGDPITRAPLQSHPYSYASHLIYGAFTECARNLFRRFFGRARVGAAVVREARATGRPVVARKPADSRRTLAMSFLMGATAGPRTSAPLFATAWAAKLGWIDVKDSPLAMLGSTPAVALTTPMAIGELIVDKLPSTPDRTDPPGLAARAVSGAISGAALAGGRSWPAALSGAMGAIVATYACHRLREGMADALGHDFPVAAAEDLIAFGGATMVCLASLGLHADTDAREDHDHHDALQVLGWPHS